MPISLPENDFESMPDSYREAFQRALVRTHDWIRRDGPEPKVNLDGTPIAAQTLFDLMTKFRRDEMQAIEIQLTYEILGGVREAEQNAIRSDPSCGNAAKYLVRRIGERKAELERRGRRL
jgi:hypothetical protein